MRSPVGVGRIRLEKILSRKDFFRKVLLNIRKWRRICLFNLSLKLQQNHKTFYLHSAICTATQGPAGGWMIEELPAFSPLFVSNEARDSSSWQPTKGAPVGRHPLMAADEWGSSRATGVRVGRMRAPSRWGLIWPSPLPPPHADQLLLCTMGRTSSRLSISNHTKWRWEVSGTSKVSLIARHLRERSITDI